MRNGERIMSKQSAVFLGLAVAACLHASLVVAAEAATPFKLGTFRDGSREFLGLVLQDKRVVDISAANAAFEREHRGAAKVRAPGDMQELIARYDQDVG